MMVVQETENLGKAPATSVVAPRPMEAESGDGILDSRTEMHMVSPGIQEKNAQE
jgi:hypothetical protein